MSARRRSKRLDAVVSVRCTHAERSHWERWLQEHSNGKPLTLSQGIRLWANNTTGLNDPPELEPFGDRHIREWIEKLTSILRSRHDHELGLAAGLAICQCCLHGHDLIPHLHHFLS